jgi:hypothetical protein
MVSFRENSDARERRRNLFEQLKALARQFGREQGHARGVCAGMGETCHKTASDGIGNSRHDDGDGFGDTLNSQNCFGALRGEYIDIQLQ